MNERRRLLGAGRAVLLAACVCGLTACSVIRTAAIKNVANTLAAPGDTFTSDDDPELVRRAVPFALKLYESLLVSVPKHEPLLVATCSGYTGYAYAFVETDADLLREEEHHDEVTALRDEAVKLYLRAKDFCLRAVDVKFPGLAKPLVADPVTFVTETRVLPMIVHSVPVDMIFAALPYEDAAIARARPGMWISMCGDGCRRVPC